MNENHHPQPQASAAGSMKDMLVWLREDVQALTAVVGDLGMKVDGIGNRVTAVESSTRNNKWWIGTVIAASGVIGSVGSMALYAVWLSG